jgi:hypothetical protein
VVHKSADQKSCKDGDSKYFFKAENDSSSEEMQNGAVCDWGQSQVALHKLLHVHCKII